ncbi:MAG: alpha/beta fold hydrolase [Propionibacteriaceae bacterium]|nr:alpha/beta fold hydrolase [Propionibacteriaceae bacterium]
MPHTLRPSVLALACLLTASLALSGCSVLAKVPLTPTASVSSSAVTPPVSVTSPSGTGTSDFPLPTPTKLYTDFPSPDRQIGPVPDVKVPGEVAAPGNGIAGYLAQKVTWTDCPSTGQGTDNEGKSLPTQCASVLAPLDWHNPDAQAITLKMKRLPATKTPALGDLFINPGGPGGSAQDYVTQFDTKGLEQYNIVGVDPRGSGESTPVKCGTADQTLAYYDLDWSPETQAERDALLAGVKTFAQQCRQGSGALLDHISTIEAVYDFEMIRRLLGDSSFNYLGTSYGTFIGAVYAQLYPEHAGHMVLDAAVNITDNESVSQSAGFELALHKFAQWCAADSECKGYLGSSESEVINAIVDILVKLDGNPIKVGDRVLTQSQAINGIALYMYLGTQGYHSLEYSLAYVLRQGNGQYLLAAADALEGRQDDGTYGSLALSFPAIACLDAGDKGIQDAWNQWTKDEQASPIFGKYMGPGLICTVWTTKPAPQIDFTGAGAPPLVVIGGTGDNATPYQYAQWMAQQLPSAVLVTRNGVGHGSYGEGNTCIDNAVTGFLVQGTVPAKGLTC